MSTKPRIYYVPEDILDPAHASRGGVFARDISLVTLSAYEQQAEVIASQKLLIDILKKSLNTALKDIVQQNTAINLATESLKRIKQRCAEDHRKANGSCLEESIRTLAEIKKLLTPMEGEK